MVLAREKNNGRLNQITATMCAPCVHTVIYVSRCVALQNVLFSSREIFLKEDASKCNVRVKDFPLTQSLCKTNAKTRPHYLLTNIHENRVRLIARLASSTGPRSFASREEKSFNLPTLWRATGATSRINFHIGEESFARRKIHLRITSNEHVEERRVPSLELH